jgi:hypothetical protein
VKLTSRPINAHSAKILVTVDTDPISNIFRERVPPSIASAAALNISESRIDVSSGTDCSTVWVDTDVERGGAALEEIASIGPA